MKDRTAQEIATAMGISTQSFYRRIKRYKKKGHVFQKEGHLFTPKAQQLMKELWGDYPL